MKIKALTTFMVGVLIAATCLMSSCLKNDVVEYTFSSETSITSFSIGTLKVKRIGTYKSGDKKGEDSIYYENVDMSSYPFTIDQAKRKIENKDSLPIGTDISKVLTKISADTPYIIYKKIKNIEEEPVDTAWTETDSIDFSIAPNGLDFQVIAASGAKGKPYSIKINVHTLDPDSLKWFRPLKSSASFASEEFLIQQKAIFTEDRIFIFGKNKNNQTSVQYTQLTPLFDSKLNVITDTKASPWAIVSDPNNILVHADPSSALLWNQKVYFISNNTLYTLDTNSEDEFSIQPAQEQPQDKKITQLIGGVNSSNEHQSALYACTENEFITYTEGQWDNDEKNNEEVHPSLLGNRFSTVNLPVAHNNELMNTIIMANNINNPEQNGTILKRQNLENQWINYNYSQIDTLGCPNITDLSMIFYNKKLYAFGGAITSKQHKEHYGKPFSTLFSSEDNGLTWKPETYIGFPTEGKEENKKNLFEDFYNEGKTKGQGSYSAVVDNNHFIWIIWHDGSMSHGRINHLGFAPKW